jgi:hypothetical protein
MRWKKEDKEKDRQAEKNYRKREMNIQTERGERDCVCV